MRGNRALKRLDRYVGIPLVFTLGPMMRWVRTLRRSDQAPRTIGVIKEAAIGDTVVLASALADLRKLHPLARIILFAGPTNHAFAKMLSVPDEVQLLPLSQPHQCVSILRRSKLDLLIDAGQWPRINALISILSGAKRLVGFKTPGQHRHYGYDDVVVHRADLHEVENFRRLVAGGDAPADAPGFDINYKLLPPPTTKPYAVLHAWPGGERSELKEWAAENWVAIARHLSERGLSIVLTGGPGDRPRNDQLHKLMDGIDVLNLAGNPMHALPSLLRQSEIVVSVNTGLMHLAAAMDVPTVGLHGPTSALRWGPKGTRSIAVVSAEPASQYLSLGFEYPASCNAMRALHADAVIDAIDALMLRSSPHGVESRQIASH
jgi:heptosyltransferase I